MIAQDESFPLNADERTMKAYVRRVRVYALQSLMDEAAQAQKKTMTRTDAASRRAAVEKGAADFARSIRERASRLMLAGAQVDEIALARATNIDVDWDYNSQRGPGNHEISQETDAELAVEQSNAAVVVHTATGEEFAAIEQGAALSTDASYSSIAHAFMLVLQESGLREAEGPWKHKADRRCPECLNDDTVGQVDKERQWEIPAKLKAHIETGVFHTPLGRWRRTQQIHASEGWLIALSSNYGTC